MSDHRERDDDYTWKIYQINDRYRVVLCAEGLQYVIQYRQGNKDQWVGQKYFSRLQEVERGLTDLKLPLDSWLRHVAKAHLGGF